MHMASFHGYMRAAEDRLAILGDECRRKCAGVVNLAEFVDLPKGAEAVAEQVPGAAVGSSGESKKGNRHCYRPQSSQFAVVIPASEQGQQLGKSQALTQPARKVFETRHTVADEATSAA